MTQKKETIEATEQSLSRLSLFRRATLQLLPLAGVFFLDWNIFAIICLYWIETLIVFVCGVSYRLVRYRSLGENFGVIAGITAFFSAGQYLFLFIAGISMGEIHEVSLSAPFTTEPSILLNAAIAFVLNLSAALRGARRKIDAANPEDRLLQRLLVGQGAILAAYGVGIHFGKDFTVAIVVLVALKMLFEFLPPQKEEKAAQ